MRKISIYYLSVLLILVTGCSNQDNVVIIDGDKIKNIELVNNFYSNVQNNESSTLVIENRNGIEGQKSTLTYKFDGNNISYEVVEPKENKDFVITCKKIEKENKKNITSYNLTKCENTLFEKDSLSIIEIPN
ncbi:hypothetical protein ACIQ1D_20025 [Lysinibacillus xylanilyticus]|uniref:hypothetical protein n=1 Tax=Lysinibacillus xylanilyticus TaxID=582475 RepID=UPI0038172382